MENGSDDNVALGKEWDYQTVNNFNDPSMSLEDNKSLVDTGGKLS